MHPVEGPTAKLADNPMLKRACTQTSPSCWVSGAIDQKNRTLEELEAEDGVCLVTPTTKPQGGELTEQQKGFTRMLSVVRAVVEPPVPRGQATVRFYQGALSGPQEAHRPDRDAVCTRPSLAGATPVAALGRRGAPVKTRNTG